VNPARRGEVWLLDLGQPKDDHEQAGRRPAVILQTDDLSVLSTVVIVPLTTQSRRAGFASTVWIPANEAGQDRDSVALCHQIRVLDRRKLRPPDLKEIDLTRFCEMIAQSTIPS
jgi:mRNA interferase MazF